MKKLFMWLFTFSMVLISLCACGTEQETLTVCSFSAANEQFSVSNGIIVLSDTEEIFCGGDLKTNGEYFDDVVSFSTTFYILSEGENRIILSNSLTDHTGTTTNVPGDLGQVSGDGIIGSKIDDVTDWKNNLYFELTTINVSGDQNTYLLQMSVNEIT